MFNLLDLFSGIGGFSLGLERTGGFKTVAFCEIDPFCRKVLKKHWPEVPCYEDITTLTGGALHAGGIKVDAICGGFPCQDISTAGKGAGMAGARSGLWSHYARLVGELRPRYVIVENVAALLGRGLDRVLGDLAAIGYDAEWHCIPASAVGAPHRRDRIWIVAYATSDLWRTFGDEIFDPSNGASTDVTDAESTRTRKNNSRVRKGAGRINRRKSTDVANPKSGIRQRPAPGQSRHTSFNGQNTAHANKSGLERRPQTIRQKEGWDSNAGYTRVLLSIIGPNDQWNVEPDVGRVANGVSSRMDRLKSLGNAVVPQIPEIIGLAILEAESQIASSSALPPRASSCLPPKGALG